MFFIIGEKNTSPQGRGTKIVDMESSVQREGVKLVVGLARRSQLPPKTTNRVDVALEKELEKCGRLNLYFDTPSSAKADRFHYTSVFKKRALKTINRLASKHQLSHIFESNFRNLSREKVDLIQILGPT